MDRGCLTFRLGVKARNVPMQKTWNEFAKVQELRVGTVN
jgi:hypothetical protein